MENEPVIALIVIRPGPLRDSLQTLVASMPQIQIVAESRSVAALLQLGTQLPPDLVLMEAALPGNEACAALHKIKAKWRRTRTVILVENADQQRQAEAAGADAVLYQGHPAGRFVAVVERLLGELGPEGSCASE